MRGTRFKWRHAYFFGLLVTAFFGLWIIGLYVETGKVVGLRALVLVPLCYWISVGAIEGINKALYGEYAIEGER